LQTAAPAHWLLRAAEPAVAADPEQARFDGAVVRAPRLDPAHLRMLTAATIREVVDSDRTTISMLAERKRYSFPSLVLASRAGFYLISWKDDPGGKRDVVDLATGLQAPVPPKVVLLAGVQEASMLRAHRSRIVWMKQSVSAPPPQRASPGEEA